MTVHWSNYGRQTKESSKVDISSLEDELRSCCTHTQWLQYNDEIESDLSKHRSLLTERRNKKIETSLLSKGLKFCPTPPEVEQIALSQDLSTFYRRIRLKEFFLDEPPSDPEPFYRKSTWTPPKNRVPSLETYIQAVSSQVCSTDTLDTRAHDNLPREERQALSSLKNRSDIIIKPADKGSAVVVMDRQQYIDEAMKHLNNRSHYALPDSDPTFDISSLEDELRSCCTHTQWLQYNDEIESDLSKHRSLLTERRNKKIDTLDTRAHDNLPREERQALSSLKNRSDIIIKPADKGSAVVVMDRQQYIDEAMKHLNNRSHYALPDSDPTLTKSPRHDCSFVKLRQADKESSKNDCVSGHSGYWIGLHQPDPDDPFVWSDQTPVDYTKWARDEPNHGDKEDCAHYYTYVAGWNDRSCTDSLFFVCKRPTSCY
nr:low affinity immunoglobulin epsilon Fc receptor-like [Lytechinus pictus]